MAKVTNGIQIPQGRWFLVWFCR